MKNEELTKKIKSAFTNIAPDNFQQILSDSKSDKGSVVIMTTKKNNFKRIAAVAAAFVILFAGIAAIVVASQQNAVVSTVLLDVNPSINIQLNKNEKVVDVQALNEDGKKIIGTMDFKNADLTVTVNALVGSMLRNGYLSEVANSLLVTVEGENHETNEKMRKRVEDEIDAVLSGVEFNASILNQEIDDADDALEAFAEKNGISEGKAKLVMAISKELPHHTPEELAKLSINELNILAGNTESVTAKGEPSTKSYISREKAKELALKKAGAANADAIIEMCSDDGIMVYEVEFRANGFEYDVEINAVTGDVIDFEKEPIETKPVTPTPKPTENNANTEVIGEARAKEIAFKKADVTASQAKNVVVKLDREDNDYSVEFYAGDYEYDVEIDAVSGKVLDYSKEHFNDDFDDDDDKTVNKPANTQKPVETTKAHAVAYITTQKVKQIALNKAGLKESQITGYHAEFDKDDGVAVYEVEFYSGSYEYSVEINAVTGGVIDFEKDIED